MGLNLDFKVKSIQHLFHGRFVKQFDPEKDVSRDFP